MELYTCSFIKTFGARFYPCVCLLRRCRQCKACPHTRGAFVWRIRNGHSSQRFIPAYAGLLPNTCHYRLHQPVHPRIRGAFFDLCVNLGGAVRFIPAYAGLLQRRSSRTIRRTVHPRIRGAFRIRRQGHTARHAVHPRIRGAFAVSVSYLIWRSGSSPHTQGFPLFPQT